MGKLIDSDWLRAQWDEPTDWMDGDQVLHHYTWYKTMIDVAPTVDAEPVRHGRWIPKFNGAFKGGAYWFERSNCRRTVPGGLQSGYNFCPKCGERKDGEEHD